MKNVPTTIYLQIGEECPDDVDFKDLREVTWSDQRIFNNDIEFELVKYCNCKKPAFKEFYCLNCGGLSK